MTKAIKTAASKIISTSQSSWQQPLAPTPAPTPKICLGCGARIAPGQDMTCGH